MDGAVRSNTDNVDKEDVVTDDTNDNIPEFESSSASLRDLDALFNDDSICLDSEED